MSLTKSLGHGFRFLKKSAELATEDAPQGCFLYAQLLGNLHRKFRLPKSLVNQQEALRWFHRAAALGYAPAQRSLGQFYEGGFLELPYDPALSIVWYARAALNGDGEAALAMSAWYARGAEDVFLPNEDVAFEWCQLAVKLEPPVPMAMYILGQYFENGVGTSADRVLAMSWYKRAALLGCQPAKTRLILERQRDPTARKKKVSSSRRSFNSVEGW